MAKKDENKQSAEELDPTLAQALSEGKASATDAGAEEQAGQETGAAAEAPLSEETSEGVQQGGQQDGDDGQPKAGAEGTGVDTEGQGAAVGEEGSAAEGEPGTREAGDNSEADKEALNALEKKEEAMRVAAKYQDMRKRERIAEEVFRKNAVKDVLWFTSDFIPFWEKSDAVRHSASLKDQSVIAVNRN